MGIGKIVHTVPARRLLLQSLFTRRSFVTVTNKHSLLLRMFCGQFIYLYYPVAHKAAGNYTAFNTPSIYQMPVVSAYILQQHHSLIQSTQWTKNYKTR